MTSGNASTGAPTLAFAVVVCRLLLVGCRAFAACSPPAQETIRSERAAGEGRRFGRPSPARWNWLWGGWVEVAAAEDVGAAEAGTSDRRAVLVGCRRRDGSAGDQRLPVGVDCRTDGRVAAVHPDRGGVVASGYYIVVVAQELAGQAVGAGPAAVPDRPAMAKVTSAWRTTPSIRRSVAVVVRQGSRWAL